MLKVLVSNDDGVYGPGLAALCKEMEAIAELTVVAPDRDRSGASNSLTLNAPLRIKNLPNGDGQCRRDAHRLCPRRYHGIYSKSNPTW